MADDPEKETPAPPPAAVDDTIAAEVSEPEEKEEGEEKPYVPASPGDDNPKNCHAVKGDVPIRTVHGYNYCLAFTLSVNGMNLAEIAREHNFDFTKLASRARREKWRVLAQGSYKQLYREKRDPDQMIEPRKGEIPELVEKRVRLIDNNRTRIVEMADTLRAQIARVATALNAMPLDQFSDPEQISYITKSIGNLTKSAKDIADMSMVALGDEHAIRHLGAGHNKPGGGHDGPAIVINMPGILATSRRRMKPADRVVETKEGVRIAEKNIKSLGRRAITAPVDLNPEATKTEGGDDGQEHTPAGP